MIMLKKIAFLICLSFSYLLAGDNSQATLGDIKEAVYKLIIENKRNAQKKEMLHAIVINTKNDAYIKKYADDNEAIIKKLNLK